ncbi:hypothetical protein BCON_0542g00010 [Botryotinia convoluta]|uniref:Uncharacterized protein n=1 Tax=Botryotinia convoluta TaxID=54673 RepID=A0A4Z1HA28_9HELO|nr:hypothetical protein BCON_0542g00010 [Botryotinia convoluta]
MAIEGVQGNGGHGKGSGGSGDSVVGRKGILGRWDGAWARGGLTEYIPCVGGRGRDSRSGGKGNGAIQEVIRCIMAYIDARGADGEMITGSGAEVRGYEDAEEEEEEEEEEEIKRNDKGEFFLGFLACVEAEVVEIDRFPGLLDGGWMFEGSKESSICWSHTYGTWRGWMGWGWRKLEACGT